MIGDHGRRAPDSGGSKSSPRKPVRRLLKLCTGLIFLVVIGFPGIGMLAGLKSDLPNEFRRMRQQPSLPASLELPVWETYTRDFEKFTADNFYWRSHALRILALFKRKFLGVTMTDKVTIGRDGWLFDSDSRRSNSISNYIGDNLFSEEQMDKSIAELQKISDDLAEQGIHFLLMLVPVKSSIYPEKLPPNIIQKSRATQLDYFLDRLRKTSSIDAIDVRPQLIAGKRKMLTYSPCDIHWTNYGSFLASRELLRRLSKKFPEIDLSIMDRYAFEQIPARGWPGDLARMALDDKCPNAEVKVLLDGYKIRRQKSIEPIVANIQRYEQENTSLPRVLFFNDSLIQAMMQFLNPHFSRVLYVSNSNFLFDAALQEKPDAVVYQLVERNMDVFRNPLRRDGYPALMAVLANPPSRHSEPAESPAAPEVVKPEEPPVSVLTPTVAAEAKANAREEKEARWLRETKKRHRVWRESIPDYEKRLYDRVKKINKRTVTIERLLVIAIVLQIIVVPVVFVFMTKLLSRGILGKAHQPPVSDGKRSRPTILSTAYLKLRAWVTGAFGRIDTDIPRAAVGRWQRRLAGLLGRLALAVRNAGVEMVGRYKNR